MTKKKNKKKKDVELNKFGFFASLTTSVLVLVTFAIAILTPPLSGPFCKAGCFNYPYTDITSRFPRDYVWMYFAILLILSYLVLIVCLHRYASKRKKLFSLIGMSFAILSAGILVTDYFIQVSVIQASLVKGESDCIAMLTQFNPHGLFIALEELGYLLMSISFLFTAFIFSGTIRLEYIIKWTLLTGFVLSIAAFIAITLHYGIYREYRFEIAIISINWLVLIFSGIALSIFFKRSIKNIFS